MEDITMKNMLLYHILIILNMISLYLTERQKIILLGLDYYLFVLDLKLKTHTAGL